MTHSESKYFATAVRMDEAFLKLLEKKDFAYITVKEICERGERPKTKKTILKVENNIQYTTIERDNVVSENNLVIHSNVKVENDDQSKLVFGQPEGGSQPVYLLSALRNGERSSGRECPIYHRSIYRGNAS